MSIAGTGGADEITKQQQMGHQTHSAGGGLYRQGGVPRLFLQGRPRGGKTENHVHRAAGQAPHGKDRDIQAGGEPAFP